MTEKKIKEIISDLKEKGFQIKVRDIAFMLLSKNMPEELAYKALFMDEGYENYNNMSHIVALRSYWKYNVKEKVKTIEDDSSDSGSRASITFDENRKAMEKLITDLTQEIKDDNFAEDRDKLMAQKVVADLRIKLADKFGVQEMTQEQIVIVEPKFNAICQCGREIHIPTIEELKQKYNLVEAKNKK